MGSGVRCGCGECVYDVVHVVQVCVWLGAVWVERGGEWMRELGLDFTNSVWTGGVLDMCLCFGCGGVVGEWVGGLDQGRERWGWCYVCVRCESGILCIDSRSRYLCIVLGGYLHI